MRGKPLNILIFEDNPADARLIQELLHDVPGAVYQFERVDRLSHGLDRLKTNSVDIVLLDLGLRDSHGLDTFLSLSERSQKLPVVVITGLNDEAIAIEALKRGAQDYLVKGQLEGPMLWRSLCYAVERNRVQYQNEISLKILELLNRREDQTNVVREIIRVIKEFSGAEAVGIRLKNGDNYPYYQASGFPPGHIEAENGQCAIQQFSSSSIISHKVLSGCMCGNIIHGRFDADKSFFTNAGSFWTNCVTDFLANEVDIGIRDSVLKRCSAEGYQSIALVPLSTEDGNIGLLHICDHNRNKLLYETIQFFEGIGQSIGVILKRKQAEEKLFNSYVAIKKTLNDAINTLAKVVEVRDPYTAGHQQRVARLSVAIAKEMHLEDEKIEQIRMAAIVHDIGKINVPAELLAKPGRLSILEYQVVKAHSSYGFDIVKGMDLPCSIAQTILQHHERLDGSGYPEGLTDKDIILEARILAVADVVEAMASHRPYRPALGLARALEEISSNSDILYDPVVVNTCRKLFAEGIFAF
jgi:putative nucleotidyltransferase with HDIG domain